MSSSPFESLIGGHIPYGSIFFYSLLAAIVMISGLFAGIYLVGGLLFKGKGNVLAAWNVAVASSVPYVAGMLGSMVLSYLSLILGLVVYWFGSMISILCVYDGIKEAMALDDNRSAFAVPLAYLVMMFLIYVLVRILIV